MGDYVLSRAADGDLTEIYTYSFRTFGEVQAESYFLELSRCLRMLADNPRLGRGAGLSRRDMLKHAHGPHVIYYVIEEPGIFVVRVLHCSMDGERHLPS